MYHSNKPQQSELPSTVKLIKSTIIALLTAIALLITVVLPAEYGVDPTGIGRALGLKKMGEIKVSLAEELKQEEALNKAEASVVPAPITETVVEARKADVRQDTLQVFLAPNAAAEIKVKMVKGAVVSYNWSSDAGKVNFDVHGDSEPLKIRYHNYSKGSVKNREAEIEAAFDGYHGWFWRNRSGSELTVTLNISGEYEELKRVK